MTLLAHMHAEKAAHREHLRPAVWARLRAALGELLPGEACWVYGSLTRAGGYRDTSDVDLALECEPVDRSLYSLGSLFEEKIGRPVDLVLLGETRLAEKIRREGERWIA